MAYNPIAESYALHPIDQAYWVGRTPEGTPADRDVTEKPSPPGPSPAGRGEKTAGYPFSRVALLGRAAAYFRAIRKPDEEIARLRTLDALEPQLAEFDYLVALGDFDAAARVLIAVDFKYMLLWGHARRVVELHSSIVERIADKNLRSISLGNLGLAYADLGQAKNAIGFYEQALVIDREIGDRRGEGADLGNLGAAYANLGQAARAIECYEQALVILRAIGDRGGEGAVLGNLGIAYRNLGQVERAIEYYEQQLVIVRAIGDRRGEGNALGNLGVAYKNLGQIARAIEFYEQQLVIVREIGDRQGEGNVLNNLGVAYEKLGQIDKALAVYRAALIIYKEIGNPQSITVIERNIQRVVDSGAKDGGG